MQNMTMNILAMTKYDKYIVRQACLQTGLTRPDQRVNNPRPQALDQILSHRFRQLACLLPFILIANTSTLLGQVKNISNGNQQWLHYYNQIQLSDKWTWLSDGGYRWKGGFDENFQYVLRTAIGYAISPAIRISTGFAHLGFYSSGKIDRVEFRPYQELLVINKFNKVGLNHRYRIEERFFNPVINGQIQTSNSFNFRFRYSLIVNIPLFNLSKDRPEMVFMVNIGDEIFINAGNNIVNRVFDQNRLVFSPTFKLSERLTVSLTWNSQFAGTSTQARFVYTNVFWFQVSQKIVLKKKRKMDSRGPNIV